LLEFLWRKNRQPQLPGKGNHTKKQKIDVGKALMEGPHQGPSPESAGLARQKRISILEN